MTYASKIPADAPGLQLDKPQARTLRKGPVLTSIADHRRAVIIAVVRRPDSALREREAANPDRTDTSTKDITLPDNVRDAPENNAGATSSRRGSDRPRRRRPTRREQRRPGSCAPGDR